ncbi:MAG: helix-turn-helix domain-containing protein [Parvibaculaceae bacterium]|nr:helix-turn-helix domain-containing protein [Parvibaculaceae bacterium]
MDIAEVVKCSGLPASTLRFYEEKGLIQSTGRHGLRRLFDPGVVEQLALISLGRTAGFSLEEIGEMFTPAGPQVNRELLLEKADELDKTIKRLTLIGKGLRHAAACQAPTHVECPKFQRMMRGAVKSHSVERQASNGRGSMGGRKLRK